MVGLRRAHLGLGRRQSPTNRVGFGDGQQEVGLDEYEVRNARGWDRHMILTLLSVVGAVYLPPPDTKKAAGPGSLAAFRQARAGETVPEIRQLWRRLILSLVTAMANA